MTEIEAIKEIEERVQITEHVGGSYVDCVDIEALRIAIFALKQMEKKQLPGENATSDCISRQGLRESLLSEDYEAHDYCFPCKEIMKRIDKQPPAKPEQRSFSCGQENDMISRKAAIAAANRADYRGLTVEDVTKVTDEVIKGLKRLPSAQPEQRWISVTEKLPGNRVSVIICYREWQQYLKRYVYSIVIGWYARKHSVREDVFNEWEADCDYDEDEDEFYIQEGWYEFTTQGNADLMNWYINAEVVAWMPLPEPFLGE